MMKKCKKCLHIDVCEKLRPLEYCLDKGCSHYKNEADVVPKSEVEKIFEEIEKIATAEGAYDYVSIQEIAELKKKYTEVEHDRNSES